MSVTFTDCNPVYGSMEAEIIASCDLLLQTGNWACFKFISWLSSVLHPRMWNGFLKDSGRILPRTIRVPAGLFMNLNKQSYTPSSPEGRIYAENGFSAMTERVADCIRNVIPHPIAIFIPGESP